MRDVKLSFTTTRVEIHEVTFPAHIVEAIYVLWNNRLKVSAIKLARAECDYRGKGLLPLSEAKNVCAKIGEGGYDASA